jgi:hypothetical protein
VPDRPDRMRRNGRPVDQHFQLAEKLFRRFAADHLIGGKLSNMGLSFDTPPSVNREKFSESQDVLFSETNEFANWGVWSIKVGDLPSAFPETEPAFRFYPQHTPMEDNYGHSEIWSDQIPPTGSYAKPSKSIRKLFRTFLCQKIVVEVAASASVL